LRFAQEGDASITLFEKVSGDAASGVDVVDSDEIAVAALGGMRDVGVDQHDGDLGVLDDLDDFAARCGEGFGHVGTEDHAFGPERGELANLVPEIRNRRVAIGFVRRDQLDTVVEPCAMTVDFLLHGREELELAEIGNDQSDDAALAERTLREERTRAIAFLDEPAPLEFGQSPADGHPRDAEACAERRLARQLHVVRKRAGRDVRQQTLEYFLPVHASSV